MWYREPALQWEEALPLGNSHLGAMVYGGVQKDELQLNQETIWAGGPHNNNNIKSLAALPDIRKLIFDGKNKEAEAMVNANFKTRKNGMPFQTAGSLFLNFSGQENVTEYYRELDLQKAVATTRYKANGVNYTREYFSSYVDNVIVVRLTADKKGALSFSASYTSPLKNEISVIGKKLIIRMQGNDHEGVKGMIRAESQVQIKAEDGKVNMENNNISVAGATSAIIYVSIATNFVNYQDISADESRRASDYLEKHKKRNSQNCWSNTFHCIKSSSIG